VPFRDSTGAIKQRAEDEFRGKIQTGRFKCLTGLYTPTEWDARHVLERARRRPDAHLELEFVYGFAGNTKFLIEKGQRIDPQSSFVSPNLFFTSTREVAYFAAATGIVLRWNDAEDHDKPSKTAATNAGGEERDVAPPQAGRKRQRFFTSHDNDILCIALDESRNYAATGQVAPLKVAKGVSCNPTVSIWDVHSMQELAVLDHTTSADEPSDSIAGVQGVCFSEDGRLVISVCRNTHHTLFVWEWRSRKLLFRENTCQGTPPCVYGVRWNPIEINEGNSSTKLFDFCSFGVKHIIFWKEAKPVPGSPFKRMWSQDPGAFLSKDNPKGTKASDGIDIQDVLCVEFLPGGMVVTGMQSGDMYLWQSFGTDDPQANADPKKPQRTDARKARSGVDMRVVRRITIPSTDRSRPPTRAHVHNLTVLKLRTDRGASSGATLVSGGGDGEVKLWKVKAGQPVHHGTFRIPRVTKRSAKPLIKALDTYPASDELVIGTDKCDIWKVAMKRAGKDLSIKDGKIELASRQMLVKGHADYLKGLDAHPTKDFLMATACQSDRIYIWDCDAKEEIAFASFAGEQAVACAFSMDGRRLAVGTVSGKLIILKSSDDKGSYEAELQPLRVTETKAARMPIHDCVSEISEIKYSPNNKMLAVASHDQMIDIYNCVADNYTRLARCRGHSSTVLHLDWSANSRVLQSSCAARELLYWDTWWGFDDPDMGAAPRRRIGLQNIEDQRDATWASWSCTIGFNVMGIYPEGYGTDDINMVARSPCERFLAAVDDRGGVLLYNYPSIVDKQKHYWYVGHSSFVENVKWLKAPAPDAKHPRGGKQLLCSAGGADRAVFQWRLVIDVDSPKQGLAALEAPTPLPESPSGSGGGKAPLTVAQDALEQAKAKARGLSLTSPSFVEQRAELASQAALIRQQEDELDELKRRVQMLELQKQAAGAGAGANSKT